MKPSYSEQIKQKAKDLGFSFVGISKADFLEDEVRHFEQWLKQNANGKMQYMENYFDKRLDPRKLVEGTKSVVSLMYNYFNPIKQIDENAPKISMYAYGRDYHFVIKDKLKALFQFMQDEIGEVGGRYFVDSAPIMDKAWAKRAGLGWIGKHSLLINKKQGSHFFIAELLIDLELDYDTPMEKDYCGRCTRCIDACPTNAIIKPYVVDGSKCISYFTIELKDAIPQWAKTKMDNWMFGCDICQQVCPWNRFSLPHEEPLFNPHPDLMAMTKNDWEHLELETFQTVFKKSAVKRTKFSGLTRNINFLK